MRAFRKHPAPKALAQAERAWLQTLDQAERRGSPAQDQTAEARAQFDQNDKAVLREHLVKEQSGLCAFCLSRITKMNETEDRLHGTTVAHCTPIRVDPRRALDWSNLLGSCLGRTSAKGHCDRAQGHQALSVNPANPADKVNERVRYMSSGRLKAADPQLQRELDVVLNLNCERLQENRVEALNQLHRELPKGDAAWTRALLRRKLEEWSTPDAEGNLREYAQIAIQYLEKKLHQLP